MRTFKKILTIILVVTIIFTGNYTPVLAIEAPTAPDAPSITTETEVVPEAPTQPSAPSHESNDSEKEEEHQAPSQPEQPSEEQSNSTESTSSESENPNNTSSDPDLIALESEANETNGSGNVGDTTIQTGDAANDANLSTLANNNISAEVGEPSGTKIINEGNGSESTNSGSSTSLNNSDTTQNNSASVGNSLDQSTTTGKNDASFNVGNSTINTGDANITGTIFTGVNTNLSGVSVSEFEVADVHTGDLVLDFAANCIINCGSSNSIYNTANGANSSNNGSITDLSNNNTFQNNDADIGNNMTLSSNSGNNDASYNTNGESSIETGNANVSANALTFANNNIEGNIVFGVVDIFGTLIGDIILPELSVIEAGSCSLCQQSDALIANTNNGANSDNTASLNSTTNDATFQTNNVNIENNLILSSTTGNNDANRNTGGETFIETGDSNIEANTINIANSNLNGGNWWLVIVNKAGQWVGQLLGAPDGSTLAGSEGTQFSANENGDITVTNSGNGAGSVNSGDITKTSDNTTQQTNTANIVNNLNLSANTGGNDANNNTGGSNTIKTGDAQIIANLVNFANNNIKTGGKLIVTVVNVFGSWIGDFVTPGSHKNNTNAEQANNQTSNQPESPSINSQSSDNDNNNNSESPSSNQTNNGSSSNNNSSNNTVVIAASNVSLNVPTNNNSVNDQVIKVAGISSGSILDVLSGDSEDKDSKTKGININLAWLIVLIPAGLAYKLIKRKFNPLKFLSRKTV